MLDFTEQLYGGPKTGLRRGKFILESVLDLKARLRQIRSDLVVGIGYTEEVIAKCLSSKGNLVLAQEEVTPEEMHVDDAIAKSLKGRGKLQLHWGLTAFHADDVPFGDELSDFPTTSALFLDRVMQNKFPDIAVYVRSLFAEPRPGSLPLPADASIEKARQFTPSLEDLPFHADIENRTLPPLHRFAAFNFKGGETHGLAQLQKYVWGKGGLEEFKQRREGMYGVDFSSKLSPWLSLGCLSPRHIWREVGMFEKRRKTNESTIGMKFTLAYRDWTKFLCQKYDTQIFSKTGIIGNRSASRFGWDTNATIIRRWKEGRTGVPFIDAIMRELQETGYISNRGRFVASNFFTTDLWQDWRLGAAHFESCLIDYDVASNWVNWLISANLLNEKNIALHPVRKSMELDPDGGYIRRWAPELASLSNQWIHCPWTAPVEVLDKAGVELGQNYPKPVRGKYLL